MVKQGDAAFGRLERFVENVSYVAVTAMKRDAANSCLLSER